MSQKAAARPPSRGLHLHTDQQGNHCISVTKTSNRNGKRPGRRLTTLRGVERDIVYPHIAAILRTEEEINLEGNLGEYHPIDETTAVHLQLAMMAVRHAATTVKAQTLGRIVAEMHNAEARWWYAHYRDRHRPARIVQAIALVWA